MELRVSSYTGTAKEKLRNDATVASLEKDILHKTLNKLKLQGAL